MPDGGRLGEAREVRERLTVAGDEERVAHRHCETSKRRESESDLQSVANVMASTHGMTRGQPC